MFTGLVQAVGTVSAMEGGRLVLTHDPVAEWEPWRLGESVAVDGCCLTVVAAEDMGLQFELSEETLRRTCLGRLTAGRRVNLERAMRASDRFGGHIVQGHVDAVGKVVGIDAHEGSWTYRFSVPGGRYLIDKGSITINGVSLTVVNPQEGDFDVALIPHTQSVTTLGDLQIGDAVNIEYDVIAKHVERLMQR